MSLRAANGAFLLSPRIATDRRMLREPLLIIGSWLKMQPEIARGRFVEIRVACSRPTKLKIRLSGPETNEPGALAPRDRLEVSALIEIPSEAFARWKPEDRVEVRLLRTNRVAPGRPPPEPATLPTPIVVLPDRLHVSPDLFCQFDPAKDRELSDAVHRFAYDSDLSNGRGVEIALRLAQPEELAFLLERDDAPPGPEEPQIRLPLAVSPGDMLDVESLLARFGTAELEVRRMNR